ncbi:MAG: YlbF family regulator [Oscillospiraceae bacterium]|nr:YlbF family regulator [Oscillospiraceae bacterium]
MDIITMARELGKEIQKDARYTAYVEAQEKADADQQLQDMIGQFNLKKIDLQQEIQNPDKTKESLQAIDMKLKELYAEIMGNEKMVAYNVAKREMDSLLSFVQEIITAAANGEDPDTVEQSTSACSGSCATCGGCN